MLVEWAEAFNAKDWEQIKGINNPGVKEGEALMTPEAEISSELRSSERERAPRCGVATIEDAEAKTDADDYEHTGTAADDLEPQDGANGL